MLRSAIVYSDDPESLFLELEQAGDPYIGTVVTTLDQDESTFTCKHHDPDHGRSWERDAGGKGGNYSGYSPSSRTYNYTLS